MLMCRIILPRYSSYCTVMWNCLYSLELNFRGFRDFVGTLNTPISIPSNVELTHYSLKYFNETTNPRTCKNIYNPRNFAPTNSTDLTVHSALQKSIQVNICHTMLKETNH